MPVRLYNKLENSWHLSNKKALFLNMRAYYQSLGQDPFHALPVTFLVRTGLDDPEFQKFKAEFKGEPWIIKPGENTNQG